MEPLNQAIYREENLVLCHNDVNWGNVLFSTDSGKASAIFIDWGRAGRNVVGADFLYLVPGGLRGYEKAVLDAAIGYYIDAAAELGRTLDANQIYAGAYYAAMQWAIERAPKTREPLIVSLAIDMAQRLARIYL